MKGRLSLNFPWILKNAGPFEANWQMRSNFFHKAKAIYLAQCLPHALHEQVKFDALLEYSKTINAKVAIKSLDNLILHP